MDKNDNGDFNYVQEKVKTKTKKRIRKALVIAGGTLVAAVVFGFVSRFIFTVSEGPVNKLLGITPTPVITMPLPTEIPRISVKLVSPTAEPTPVIKPDRPTAGEEKPTESVEVLTTTPVEKPTPTEAATPTPDLKDPDGLEGSESDDETGREPDMNSALYTYMQMMTELREVAATASKSLVRVYSVTTGINWMDESIETKTERTGIVLADNGVELLVFTDYASLAGSDRMEIRFADGTVLPAELYNYDADAGFAVVAVVLDSISEETRATYKYAVISHNSFSEGEPIIAIGRPNGYFGAVEYGFITHTGKAVYFTDGVETGFTTNIACGTDSDAVMVSLTGTLLGVVRPADTDATDLSSFTTLLEKLLNHAAIPYFGIRAENIPEDILANFGLNHGIYVNEAVQLSPAAEAGLKKGDIITALGDNEITGVSEFYEQILAMDEGTLINVKVYRSSKHDDPAESIIVTLGHK